MFCGKRGCCAGSVACLGVLIWVFSFYPVTWYRRHLNDVPPVSYDGRIDFNLADLRKPTTEDEIVSIVQEAYNSQPVRKIRVLGDGHSWSEIAQTPDIMISLTDYQGLVGEPDKERMTATFKAGTALSQISQILEENELAMINLGSVAGQSIAGAISTATHGTGIAIGNLADLVTSLKFVSGTGEVKVVSEDDEDPSLFKAAQVSIGLLGVLTEVTVRVKELYYLQEIRTPALDLDYCLNNIDELVDSAEYVKMWIEFYHNYCILFQTNVTSNTDVTHMRWWEGPLTYYTFAVSTRITYLLPSFTSFFMRLVTFFGFGMLGVTNRTEISYNILNDYFELPIHQEGEVIVPYEDAAETVRTIRDIVISNNIPVNYITEVRFVKGDDIWMSPEYTTSGSASCAITLTIHAPSATVLDYFDRVYAATGARVHWGKIFSATPAKIGEWYPQFSKFLVVRKAMDPKGVFLNDFLTETFVPSGDA